MFTALFTKPFTTAVITEFITFVARRSVLRFIARIVQVQGEKGLAP
jgi:hypothetical protein